MLLCALDLFDGGGGGGGGGGHLKTDTGIGQLLRHDDQTHRICL